MDIDSLISKQWFLLPGTLCTGEVFSPFLDALGVSQSQRTVIPIRYQSVDEYERLLTEDVPPGSVVCGFSLGAGVAAHLADRLDIGLLVLFGVNPHADDPEKYQLRRDLEGDVLAHGGRKAMSAFVPEIHGVNAEVVLKTILYMAEACGHEISAQTTLALGRPGACPALSKARYPVLALTGSEDRTTPLSLARDAVGATLNGKVTCLAGLGHYALLEDPQACKTVLELYLKELIK